MRWQGGSAAGARARSHSKLLALTRMPLSLVGPGSARPSTRPHDSASMVTCQTLTNACSHTGRVYLACLCVYAGSYVSRWQSLHDEELPSAVLARAKHLLKTRFFRIQS